MVILLLIGGAAVYIQKNPKILDFFKHQNTESDIVTNLQYQIDNLNLRLNELEKAPKAEVSTADLAMLNDKINMVSDFNQKILDSKADTSHVLGLMGRVDELDSKVKNLGKVSSQGALVLTASMLVKDNAYKGPFEYEAEVLKYLAAGTSMEQPAEEIYKHAKTGVKCKKTLIKEFNSLYNEKSQKEDQTEAGKYEANYKESLEILEYYFPKDKNIFLMCGGGGYAGMTKTMLVTLGWDETKIYKFNL
mgnify:CR=1 FL=1